MTFSHAHTYDYAAKNAANRTYDLFSVRGELVEPCTAHKKQNPPFLEWRAAWFDKLTTNGF